MAASLHVRKFVSAEPNSHLVCGICAGVFTDPVINVSCGHSFCSRCLKAASKCPKDSAPVDATSLVINRALESQVDDLEVYCSYGLQWDEQKRDYVIHKDGCPLILKLGEQLSHESTCEYSLQLCPNKPSECAMIRRKDFEQHCLNCPFKPCAFADRGCEFEGSDIDVHLKECRFKSVQSVILGQQTEALMANNSALLAKVTRLEDKVQNIAVENSQLKADLLSSKQLVEGMEKRILLLEDSVRKLDGESRPRSSYILRQSRLSGLKSGQETWLMPFQFKCIGTLRGHKEAVSCLVQHRSLLFSSGSDQSIKIWDADDLSKGCRHTLTEHKSSIECLAVGDSFLYCAGADLAISVWSLEGYSLHKNIQNAHEKQIAAMAYANDRLFSSSHTLIKVWDASSMENIHTISGLHHWVRSLAFNPQKDWLYSGSHNTIEVWNCCRGKYNLTAKISHTYGSVHALEVTTQYVIAGTYNNNTHLYDCISQKHVCCLNGHIGCISSIVASPSGRFLFTASADSHVQLWNLENKLPIQSLSRHEGSVNALVLHGDLLFTGSQDSEIKVFRHFKMDMGFNPK